MTVNKAIAQYHNHGSYYLNSEDDLAVRTLIEKIQSYENVLADLKNVTKSHDLRKNPNDLPKKNGHYWCYVDDGVFHTDYRVIYFENGKWESDKWDNKTIILGWWELLRFEDQMTVPTFSESNMFQTISWLKNGTGVPSKKSRARKLFLLYLLIKLRGIVVLIKEKEK